MESRFDRRRAIGGNRDDTGGGQYRWCRDMLKPDGTQAAFMGKSNCTLPERRIRRIAAAALALVICIGRSGFAQTIVTNSDPEFTMTVPPGFVSLPRTPENLYAYATSDPTQGLPDVVVVIQRLNGTIGPEKPDVPPNSAADAKFTTTTWRGLQVFVFNTTKTQPAGKVALRTVLIPLRGGAIKIAIAEPAARESKIDADLDRWLSGIDGPTNWRSTSDNRQAARFATAEAAIPLVLSAAAIVALFKQRRTGGRNPGAKTVSDSPGTRHASATRAAQMTGAWMALSISLICLLTVLSGRRQRFVQELAAGSPEFLTWSMTWAFLSGAAVYGIVRGTIRLRNGPIPPSQPAARVESVSSGTAPPP